MEATKIKEEISNLTVRKKETLMGLLGSYKILKRQTGGSNFIVPSFNVWLSQIYGIDQIKTNTFKGWFNEGYKVKKGEKGYMFFTRPIKGKVKDKKDEEYRFFKTCFVFTEKQVEKNLKEKKS